MTPEQLAEAQKKADKRMRDHWKVVDGVLHYDGKGQSLCSAKDYSDIELWVDWKITAGRRQRNLSARQPASADLGPVQHEDCRGRFGWPLQQPKTSARSAGEKVDRPIGQWNRFFIRMLGDKVTVYFNGKLVVDNVVLENYWERKKPIYPKGQIELQHHNSALFYKNIYLRELIEQGLSGEYHASRVLLSWACFFIRPTFRIYIARPAGSRARLRSMTVHFEVPSFMVVHQAEEGDRQADADSDQQHHQANTKSTGMPTSSPLFGNASCVSGP